jgi:hypothetical protein
MPATMQAGSNRNTASSRTHPAIAAQHQAVATARGCDRRRT